MSSLREQFIQVYERVGKQNNGGFRPELAAMLLTQKLQLAETFPAVLAILRQPDAKAALYAESLEIVHYFVHTLHLPLVIWTQGEVEGTDGTTGYQILKLHQAELPQHLNPAWEKINQETGFPLWLGGFNKLEALKTYWLERLKNHEPDQQPHVIFIDDRLTNVDEATQFIKKLGLTTSGYVIDRTGKHANDSLPADVHVITNLTDLFPLVTNGNQVVFCDLDYTLIDHALVRELLVLRLEAELASFLANPGTTY